MEFNQTLFVQAGIFIAIFFILKALYFEPVLELLKRRDAATTGKTEEANQMLVQIESMKKDYNDRLHRVRLDLEKNRETRLASLRADLSKDLEQLKAKIDEGSKAHQTLLDGETNAARLRFSALAADLKKEIVDSVTSLKLRGA